MRLFIAIQLDRTLRQALVRAQESLARQGVRGRYTPPENLHLTLAFLGECPEAEPVLEAVEKVDFQPFSLALDGFGRFGDLWWAGLAESGELTACVRRLRRALADAGLPFDRKRFRPHITLLRRAVWSGEGPVLEEPEAEMAVKRISLMRSDRGKHGMIYTELGCIPARKGEGPAG